MSELRTVVLPVEGKTKLEEFEIHSNIASEGCNFNIYLTEPGWYRVLTTTRSSGGNLNISVNNNSNIGPKVYQNIGFQYSGYVKYPSCEWDSKQNNKSEETEIEKITRERTYNNPDNTEPIIYQLYNNVFGENQEFFPENRVLITQARLGYAKPGSKYPPIHKDRVNSINCYFDIYIDFIKGKGKSVQLMLNYSGKTYNHGYKTIFNAEDLLIPTIEIENEKNEKVNIECGQWDEELEYFYIPLKINHGINLQNRINYFEENYNNNCYANKFILKNQNNVDPALEMFSQNKVYKKIDYTNFTGMYSNTLPDQTESVGQKYLFAHPLNTKNFLYNRLGKNKTYEKKIVSKNLTLILKTDDTGKITIENANDDSLKSIKFTFDNVFSLTDYNLPVYLPPLPVGYAYYFQDCQLLFLEKVDDKFVYDGKLIIPYNNAGEEKIKRVKKLNNQGGYILRTRIYKPENWACSDIFQNFTPAVFVDVDNDDNYDYTAIKTGEDYNFSPAPIYYPIPDEEIQRISKIDYTNFKFLDSEDKIIDNLPYSLLDGLKHKEFNEINYFYGSFTMEPELYSSTTNPKPKSHSDLTGIISETKFTYDIEFDLINILTRLYELEQKPRIYIAENLEDENLKTGRTNDIVIITSQINNNEENTGE